MSTRDPENPLANGEAWSAFCRELDEIGQETLRPSAPVDPVEGYRYLTRMLRSFFELIMESGDAANPALTVSLRETLRLDSAGARINDPDDPANIRG